MKQQFNYFIRRASNTAPAPMTTLRRRGHPLKRGSELFHQTVELSNNIGWVSDRRGTAALSTDDLPRPVLRRRRRAPRPCRAIPPRRRGVTGPCPRTRSRAVAPRRARGRSTPRTSRARRGPATRPRRPRPTPQPPKRRLRSGGTTRSRSRRCARPSRSRRRSEPPRSRSSSDSSPGPPRWSDRTA